MLINLLKKDCDTIFLNMELAFSILIYFLICIMYNHFSFNSELIISVAINCIAFPSKRNRFTTIFTCRPVFQ